MSRGWLIVFAKAPRAGLVKTRLSPPLDLGECAELYDAMLGDVLDASLGFARRLDLLPILAFHPPDASGEMLGRTPSDYRLHVQRGVDLGQRMANAFAEAAAAGVDRILLRGSDSPSLDLDVFEDALTRLDAGDDLVLTPDQSGGYAVVGTRRPQPSIFEVAMSSGEMLEETLARAQSLGLRSSITAATLDLDTFEDLRTFAALDFPRALDLCPRTVESISALQSLTVL